VTGEGRAYGEHAGSTQQGEERLFEASRMAVVAAGLG
jgi:hypothetical protein